MAIQFTSKGVEFPDIETQYNNLREECLSSVEGFSSLPAEISTNFLQTNIIPLYQYNQALASVANGVLNMYGDSRMVYNLGATLGLNYKGEIINSVVVTFYGNIGTIVPLGFKVTNDAGNIFRTQNDIIIDATGQSSVLCINSDETIGNTDAGTVVNIPTPLDGVVSCTNLYPISAGNTGETIDQYRARCLQALRSPRVSTLNYFLQDILSIPGVNSTKYNIILNKENNTVNVILNNATKEAVAVAMVKNAWNPSIFVGVKSDSSNATVITEKVKVFNTEFDVSYVDAEEISVSIEIVLKQFTTPLLQDEVVESYIKDGLQSYIDGLDLDTRVTNIMLDRVITNLLVENSFNIDNVSEIGYVIKYGNDVVGFDEDGSLPLEYDQYLKFDYDTFNVIQGEV